MHPQQSSGDAKEGKLNSSNGAKLPEGATQPTMQQSEQQAWTKCPAEKSLAGSVGLAFSTRRVDSSDAIALMTCR